jgi:transcriptional regulator with XRE-family HTH domain
MSQSIHPLRRWLFENQETAAAFAKRAGLSPGSLSEMLQGKRRPHLDTLDKITAATNGEITAAHFQREAAE